MPVNPFRWEREFWNAGYGLVAGVDEVGRGALAGPLVAAAVIFEPEMVANRTRRSEILSTVRDSKMLSRPARELALGKIQSHAFAIGVGVVECFEIDDFGMSAANRIVLERAVFALGVLPEALMLDAFVTDLSMPQVGLIDGDAMCLSISAASIVAKVSRDRMMCDLHQVDCRFGFDQHVGYGTPEHLRALRNYGPASFHRRSFKPVQQCLTDQ